MRDTVPIRRHLRPGIEQGRDVARRMKGARFPVARITGNHARHVIGKPMRDQLLAAGRRFALDQVRHFCPGRRLGP